LQRTQATGRWRVEAIGLSRRHLYILSENSGTIGDFDMFARDEDILKAAEDWRREGRGVAIATVVETWGSAPRPVGSNLVIDKDGNFLGSVSGGCVEGAVVTEAIDVIESGKPRMLEFGVADDAAWKVGLSCGGTIRVYVEKVD
jgi:xanthine/CO dehydrogenase XdhC/CoxF family maturation factor